MSEHADHEDGPNTPFRERIAEAMLAEVFVRVPDASRAEGYREEWWSMQRIYDVAWAAAHDAMLSRSDHSQHRTDEEVQDPPFES